MSWRIAGTSLESCNCEAICPCRKINGVPGGRSTTGFCMGTLSWRVVDGHFGSTDLSGLGIVMAIRYSDDEPRSPWSYVLFVDERGDEEQRRALEDIFVGRLGGTVLEHFPWAWKPSELLAVRSARIDIDHTPGRGWFRAGDAVTVRVAAPYPGDETVTCVIPGHDRGGREIVAEELRVSDPAIAFEFSGNCGYESTFEYSGQNGLRDRSR